jgi:hypothetical protein
LVPELWPLVSPQKNLSNLTSQHITQILEQSTFSVEESDDEGSSSSDSEQEDFTELNGTQTVESILSDIIQNVNSLWDLSDTFEAFDYLLALKSFKSGQNSKATELNTGDVLPFKFFANCIRESFPQLSELLSDHLGRLALQRYQRLLHQRIQNESAENRSDLLILDDMKSKNTDSGYGSLNQSSYAVSLARSVVSSMGEGYRSKYPSLPDGALDGKAFECIACSRKVVVVNKRLWRSVILNSLVGYSSVLMIIDRKHLLEDLKAYSCIFPACRSAEEVFHERQRWINHMKLDHPAESIWETHKCPFCTAAKSEGEHGLLLHLASHLEEVSLLSLPQDVENVVNESNRDPEESSSSHALSSPPLSPQFHATPHVTNVTGTPGHTYSPSPRPRLHSYWSPKPLRSRPKSGSSSPDAQGFRWTDAGDTPTTPYFSHATPKTGDLEDEVWNIQPRITEPSEISAQPVIPQEKRGRPWKSDAAVQRQRYTDLTISVDRRDQSVFQRAAAPGPEASRLSPQPETQRRKRGRPSKRDLEARRQKQAELKPTADSRDSGTSPPPFIARQTRVIRSHLASSEPPPPIVYSMKYVHPETPWEKRGRPSKREIEDRILGQAKAKVETSIVPTIEAQEGEEKDQLPLQYGTPANTRVQELHQSDKEKEDLNAIVNQVRRSE